MPVIKTKPTSPGRRFVVKVVHPELHSGEPYKPLTEKKTKSGGRWTRENVYSVMKTHIKNEKITPNFV